jgi:MFS family permease
MADPATRRLPRPFQNHYGASLLTAIMALVPYILVVSAYLLFHRQVAHDIGASRTGLAIINGLSVTGYAFGALLGGDLINRLPQRPLFLACEGLFIIGSALAAAAHGSVMYGGGAILEGLSTGLLLVVALPPIMQRFPPRKMPVTAAIINIGFFGAVTVGPLLGGLTAYGHGWRAFYAGLAGIGFAILVLALLTLADQPPRDPDMPLDLAGIGLALPATVLPFWAVGELTGHGFNSPLFTAPMAIGIGCLVAMLLVEYHKEQPLSPVKQLWHTLPVVGTLAAMIGGAAFFTFLELALLYLARVSHVSLLSTGLAVWPEVAGVVITATLLGVLFTTRYLPVLVLGGMLLLIGGGALLLTLHGVTGSRQTVLEAAGLLGLGAGATVSPGLFLAGLSLPAQNVGRTFALVELVRSLANFILAPVMVAVALIASGGRPLSVNGLHEAIWITEWATIALTLGGVALFLLGGVGLQRPNLIAWIKENQPAIGSQRLAQTIRSS